MWFLYFCNHISCVLYFGSSPTVRLVLGPVRTDLWKRFSAIWRVCLPFYVSFSPFFCFWDGFSGNNARISLFFAPFRPFLPIFAAQPPRGRIQGRIRGMDFFSILVFFSQFSFLFFFFFYLRASDGFLIAVIGGSSLLSGRILGKTPRFRRFSLPLSLFLPFSARSCHSFRLSFRFFSRITAAALLFPTGFRQNKWYGVPLLRTDSRKTLSSVSFWLIASGFYLLSVSFLTFFSLFCTERTAYPQDFAYPMLTLCGACGVPLGYGETKGNGLSLLRTDSWKRSFLPSYSMAIISSVSNSYHIYIMTNV